MLKQVVTYTDFNDQQQTKELYFHISKARVLDNLVLIEEFQTLANGLSGPERELTTEEKQNIIRLVKAFMKLSYGVRSADGQSFRQRDELWEEFADSAAYDEFLVSLFLTPAKSMEFVMGVIPPEFRSQVAEQIQEQTAETEKVQPDFPLEYFGTPEHVRTLVPTPEVPSEPWIVAPMPEENQDDVPPWIREDREPTQKELTSMSQPQLLEVYRRKNQRAS